MSPGGLAGARQLCSNQLKTVNTEDMSSLRSFDMPVVSVDTEHLTMRSRRKPTLKELFKTLSLVAFLSS